jgi:hypothetical protein
MTHAVSVVVPWSGHGSDSPCMARIQADFVAKGSGEGLDTSCMGKLQMTPFVLEPPKEKAAGG